MPCKGSSVFDFSICSTSGRHLVCRALCQEGTSEPSMCRAVSTNPLPPRPFPHPPWHTFSPTVWEPNAPPINPPNRQLLAPAEKLFTPCLCSTFRKTLTSNKRQTRRGVWMIDTFWRFFHISWSKSSFSSTNKLRQAFFWDQDDEELDDIDCTSESGLIGSCQDLRILSHPCTHPNIIPEPLQRNQIHRQSLIFLCSC